MWGDSAATTLFLLLFWNEKGVTSLEANIFFYPCLGNIQGESWLWSKEAPLGYFKSHFCQTSRTMLRAQFTWHAKFRPSRTLPWGEFFVLVTLWIQHPVFTCRSRRALQKKEALQFPCMDACTTLGEWGGLCGASITEGIKTSLCNRLDVVLKAVCGTPCFLFEFCSFCKRHFQCSTAICNMLDVTYLFVMC